MESDDSDEWATEELPPLPDPTRPKTTTTDGHIAASSQDDDSYWDIQAADPPQKEAISESVEEGLPMLLVDMTLLSGGAIHSKFDANAVNDPVAVKTLRQKIEQDYETYDSDASLLANRTVIPCGSTVWRPALVAMRKEKPGHYFCPIFPPK